MLMSALGRRLLAMFDHGLGRHFRRRALLDALRGRRTASILPPAFVQQLEAFASCPPEQLFRQLDSQPGGLDPAQAQRVRERVGTNLVEQEKPLSPLHHLWLCYCNPFNLLLTALAVLSWVTEDLQAALVIGCMVLVSTLLRFVQETRSNRAAESLQALVDNTASVLRPGAPSPDRRGAVEVPFRDLVPGDVVLLAAGDMIPADLRVLEARNLFLNQSAITGEALPVEKSATPQGPTPGTPWSATPCASWAPT